MSVPSDESPAERVADIDLDGTFSYDGSEVRFSFNGESMLDRLAWEYNAVQSTLRTSDLENDGVLIVLRKMR